MNKHIQIAIRIPDDIYGLSNTVIRHNSLAVNYGAVWVGKPDRPFSDRTVNQLNQQIREKYETHLFIIDPDRGNPMAFQAKMQAATLKAPPDKELIPNFYKQLKILTRMKTWFKVGCFEPVKLEEIEWLDQANTAYEIQEMKMIQLGVENLPQVLCSIQTSKK